MSIKLLEYGDDVLAATDLFSLAVDGLTADGLFALLGLLALGAAAFPFFAIGLFVLDCKTDFETGALWLFITLPQS